MKKLVLAVALCLSLVRSYADEGMWLPLLLGQQVYNDMVKKGLKLKPEQLYSINKSSLKDAIIIFGGGCTGEIVSGQGLIFTNHHCGYGAIAAASSVQNNYLRDGFYAKNFQEEIPAKDLSVQFLLKIEDVTNEVVGNLSGLSGEERKKKQDQLIRDINKKYSDSSQSVEARVSPLFKNNQFLVFVYQRFKDVRLVGTPPESIGKFGGDTDNWEWPRHTGDFSVFRVYANTEGKPANYSNYNVPLRPKYHLPVSIKGYKEGDFAMIWGYPGGTNRYETSYGIKLATQINSPSLVALRDVRLKYMFTEMKKDAAVKLQLASSYAGIANYWKFFDGETKQLLKYHIYENKQDAENMFMRWAKDRPEYVNIMNDWKNVYDEWTPYAKERVYLNEGILGSPLASFTAALMSLDSTLSKSTDLPLIQKKIDEADARRKRFMDGENSTSDQKIIAATVHMFYNDIVPSQRPSGFYEALQAKYGDLNDDNTYQKFAAYVFANSILLNEDKWKNFIQQKNAAALKSDPAYVYASAFVKNYNENYLSRYEQFTLKNNELGRVYLQGIMQMDTVKAKKMYPDATFTMRTSYGNVKSYAPKDALYYDHVCTMKGILEKYVPGDYEFDLPAKLLQLAAVKDYGQYIDKAKNDLVVCFITTNDITGGNSGSPVIDGKGNLIGLAFDGNYEALSHKMAFDKDLNRTICVDVRYVLWCIDKLGGAKNLIDELTIVK